MPYVDFEMDGIGIEAEQDEPIVDLARRAGSSIPFGCANGICGTCIVTISEGGENLNEKSPDEEMTLEMFGAEKPEHRLACQCQVKGDVKLQNP